MTKKKKDKTDTRKRRTNEEIRIDLEAEERAEKSRIASLVRKAKREEYGLVNETPFRGRKLEYYLRLKQDRHIKDSQERTELITELMELEQFLLSKCIYPWIFQQWDSLEDKYLKWAWKIWGKRVLWGKKDIRNISLPCG